MKFTLNDEEANKLTHLMPSALKQWVRTVHKQLYNAIESNDANRINVTLETLINLNSSRLSSANSNHINNCYDNDNAKSIANTTTTTTGSTTLQMIITLLDSERYHYLDDMKRRNARLNRGYSLCHIIKCELNGHQLYGCIDTGAQYSLLSVQSMANCELSHLLDNRYNGEVIGCDRSSNGSCNASAKNAILGKIHATNIRIDCRHDFPISLLVVERLRPELFLIANDFLVANKCVIDCSDGKIYFKTIDKTIGCVAANKSAQLTHTVLPPMCQLKLMFKSVAARIKAVVRSSSSGKFCR